VDVEKTLADFQRIKHNKKINHKEKEKEKEKERFTSLSSLNAARPTYKSIIFG